MMKTWLGCALVLTAVGCGSEKSAGEDGGSGLSPIESADSDSGASGNGSSGSNGNGNGSADEDAGTSGNGGANGNGTGADGDGGAGNPNAMIDAASEVEFPNLDASADASGPDAGKPSLEQFCSGGGPVIKIPGAAAGTPGGNICTGTVARQRFKNALCACEDVSTKGFVNTGSFNSSVDNFEEEGFEFKKSGGSVGVNGNMGAFELKVQPDWGIAEAITAGYLDIGGSLRVYGRPVSGGLFKNEGIDYKGYINVYGDLESNKTLWVYGFSTIWRDLKVREDVFVPGTILLKGSIISRPGKFITPWVFALGQNQSKEFTLDKPCACEPSQLLDINAIIADGKQNNDNENPAVNLDPGVLGVKLGGVNIGVYRMELPCGRYYLDEINAIGDVQIKVTGRTALYVGGDVKTTGKLDVQLAPGAELDLFIGGNLRQIGYGKFGGYASNPSHLRVYVSGGEDITFVGYQPFAGNLYAPRANLISAGFIDVRGSLFVKNIDEAGYLKVMYDRDILDQGNDDACKPPVNPPPTPDAGVQPTPDASVQPTPDASVQPTPDASVPPPPPPQCNNTCDELCGNQVCKNGMCTPCVTDSDCCAPLVCYEDGTCGPHVF